MMNDDAQSLILGFIASAVPLIIIFGILFAIWPKKKTRRIHENPRFGGFSLRRILDHNTSRYNNANLGRGSQLRRTA